MVAQAVGNVIRQTAPSPKVDGPDFALFWNVHHDVNGGLLTVGWIGRLTCVVA